jgi:hypothetical protein
MSTNTKTARARGRPPKNKAARDFEIADANAQYHELLTQYQNHRIGELSAHEAAAEAMQETRKNMGNISTKTLHNLMSKLKKVPVSASDEIAPDRYDPPDHIPDPRRRR